MEIDAFKQSLDQKEPPSGLSAALQALWYDANGEWKRAHELAQSQRDEAGCWVHAYLHRVEGDESNAGYWYGRAGKAHSQAALKNEWAEIATELLA